MSQHDSNSNVSREMPSRLARRLLGSKRLAELCDRTTDALRKWDRPKSKGGLGGLVPSEFQARILREATEKELPLTAGDLIAEPNP